MSQVVEQHRSQAPQSLRIAVMTISDTRTLATDTSGAFILELAQAAGHRIVDRTLIADASDQIRTILEAYRDSSDLDAVLITGGTGISPRDQTIEIVSEVLTKLLPGYGELFRMLSFAEIGPAAMLSRAVGGLMGKMVVMVMPGSKNAVELAMTRLILPELPHIVQQARKY
jgi:molybdenum cofactor biosynthesis protein B